VTFDAIFVPDELREAVSDRAWVEAMLEVERALANAEALVGSVPAHLAGPIAEACRIELFDVVEIVAAARSVGNPAEPLVRALRERVGGEAAGYVHFGATSQDIVDSAGMLVSRRAVGLVRGYLDGAAAHCARVAATYRSFPAAARTLLQPAVPTTVGYRAALWLSGLLDARDRLDRLRFPSQLGGAAGTLAALGPQALDVATRFAAELELAEPLVPWHTNRGPIFELAAGLAASASACSNAAVDVVLLAQGEVGEVTEGDGGRSSTMPHKRNPVRAVLVRASARLVHANVAVLTSGEHELERAAGAWQAEWPALSAALAYAGGAASWLEACLAGLDLHEERIRANLRDELYSEARAFGIEGDYLGSAEELVDRVLARYEGSPE
jgi:3-carboxy-cis,cis-muconate cycloisomerase